MSLDPPPINEIVIEQNGLAKLPWILFFNNVFEGDSGTAWTPEFTNLTTVGTPQITGRYYRINQNLCFFWIEIIPDTSTTSTAGTTYCGNFPLQFQHDSACWAVSGGVGDGPGHIVSTTNRIYTPGWSAVTVPLTVIGIGAAR